MIAQDGQSRRIWIEAAHDGARVSITRWLTSQGSLLPFVPGHVKLSTVPLKAENLAQSALPSSPCASPWMKSFTRRWNKDSADSCKQVSERLTHGLRQVIIAYRKGGKISIPGVY